MPFTYRRSKRKMYLLSILTCLGTWLQITYGQPDHDVDRQVQRGPVLIDDLGHLFIRAVVRLGGRSNRIKQVNQQGIEVELKCKTMDEQANEQLLSYIAEVLKIKKNDVSMFLGDEVINKVLIVRSNRISVYTARNLLYDAKGGFNPS